MAAEAMATKPLEPQRSGTVGGEVARNGSTSRWSGGRIPAWMVAALSLLVALAAVVGIVALDRYEDGAREAQLVLRDIEEQTLELNALEWEVIAEGRFTAEHADETAVVLERIGRALGELDEADRESAATGRIGGAVAAYRDAVVEEFRLLEAGRTEEAEAIDEERVDPSYAAAREAISAVGVAYGEQAERTNLLAGAGTIGAL